MLNKIMLACAFVGSVCFADSSSTVSTAPTHPAFGLNAFSTNLNTFDAGSAKGQFKLAPQIGMRYYATKNVGVDFSIGGAFNDAVQADSTTKTVGDPGSRIFNVELGVFVNLLDLDGAYLGVLADGGFSLQRWADFDNHFRPAPTYPSFETYNMFIPYGFFGLEPGYFFNPHFSLYSKFGFNMIYFPSSKYINYADPAYNSATKSFPLKNRGDDNSIFAVAQTGLGVRFVF